jgi:hypothetical protein
VKMKNAGKVALRNVRRKVIPDKTAKSLTSIPPTRRIGRSEPISLSRVLVSGMEKMPIAPRRRAA